MKKLFLLFFALITSINFAKAQNYLRFASEQKDGSYIACNVVGFENMDNFFYNQFFS